MKMLSELERDVLASYGSEDYVDASEAEYEAALSNISAKRGEFVWTHCPGGIEHLVLRPTYWGSKALRIDSIIRSLA